MELVAGAKMRKAVEGALNTRPFSRQSWDTLMRIMGRGGNQENPLLEVRQVKNVLVILVTSNRGLVGGLNSNLLRSVLVQLKEPHQLMRNRVGDKWLEPVDENANIEIVTVGKKGEHAMNREGYNVVASFGAVSDSPTYSEARPIARLAMNEFVEGKYDKAVICYNDFVSAVNQTPKIRQLLPVSSYDIEKMIAEVGRGEKPLLEGHEEKELSHENGHEYIFEPNSNEVLTKIIPRLVTTQVYQALLEASASEHSARMVAMKNASDAAADIIDDLQFTFNQLRQAGITSEIAEISAGKAALE